MSTEIKVLKKCAEKKKQKLIMGNITALLINF